MSGVVKGVGKVFKKVGKVLQPLVKPALIAAGVVFGALTLGSAAVGMGLAAPGTIPSLGAPLGGIVSKGVQAGALKAAGQGVLGSGAGPMGFLAKTKIAGVSNAMATKAATQAATAAGGAALGGVAAPGPMGMAATALTKGLPSAVARQAGGPAMPPVPTPVTEGAGAGTSLFGKVEDWMAAHPNLVKYGGGALAAGAKGIGAAHLAKELQDEYWRRRREELEFRYPKLTPGGSAIPGMARQQSAPPAAQAPAMSLTQAGMRDAPGMALPRGNVPMPGLDRRLDQVAGGGYAMSPFPSPVAMANYQLPYF